MKIQQQENIVRRRSALCLVPRPGHAHQQTGNPAHLSTQRASRPAPQYTSDKTLTRATASNPSQGIVQVVDGHVLRLDTRHQLAVTAGRRQRHECRYRDSVKPSTSPPPSHPQPPWRPPPAPPRTVTTVAAAPATVPAARATDTAVATSVTADASATTDTVADATADAAAET